MAKVKQVPVKQLSTKTVGFTSTILKKMTSDLENDGDRTLLYTLAGVATKVTKGTGTYGEFTKFLGDFCAIKSGSDDRVRSFVAFVPPVFQDVLESQLASDKTGAGVEFCVEVHLERSDKSSTGYTYHVEPLTKIKENETVTKLLEASLKSQSNIKESDKDK